MRKITGLSVVAVFLLAVTASAGLNFTHGGLSAGYVAPEDPLESTFGIGAEVGFAVPVPNLNLSLEANYWSKGYSDPVFTTWEFNFTDINIAMSARYEFPTASQSFYPYLGGGLGLHFLSSSVDVGFGSVSASDTKLGLHTFGGLRFPVSPVVDFYVEARYTWVNPDYFSALGGIQYHFGK